MEDSISGGLRFRIPLEEIPQTGDIIFGVTGVRIGGDTCGVKLLQKMDNVGLTGSRVIIFISQLVQIRNGLRIPLEDNVVDTLLRNSWIRGELEELLRR